MPATTTIAQINREPTQWDEAFYAFLAEKERRSGSRRTVESYSRMLQHFFAGAGKAPDPSYGRGATPRTGPGKSSGSRCARAPPPPTYN